MFSLRADAERNPEGEDGVGKIMSNSVFVVFLVFFWIMTWILMDRWIFNYVQ